RRGGEPDLAEGADLVRSLPCRCRVGEERVDDGAGSADVRAEGTERPETGRERRVGEVVRGKRREVGGPPRPGDGDDTGAALFEAVLPVEARIDLRGRLLLLAVRLHKQDGVVLRQVERFEARAVSGRELRSRLEEERDVGAEPRGERGEALGRGRWL